MTSKCLGIPENIQRPLYNNNDNNMIIKIIQLNVADGGGGFSNGNNNNMNRGEIMLSWLKQQAINGIMIIGLCELNDWDIYDNIYDINKNHPIIKNNAANAGFSFSYIMINNQPYHIGIMSIYPFEVKGMNNKYIYVV